MFGCVGDIAGQRIALKPMLKVKLFYLVACMSFIYVLWLQMITTSNITNDDLIQEAIENVAQDIRYSNVYRKKSSLPKDLKYILLWTRKNFAPFYFFGVGQKKFLQNNCSAINCYVTYDRDFFDGNLTKFDAIAFNGRIRNTDYPYERSFHQKYIYFNMESADNYPECSEKFDNYFNWTATYKLDSDIPFGYILVRNATGHVVGPKIGMNWDTKYPKIDDDLVNELSYKSVAAAWFVSHCNTRSKRTELVHDLKKTLGLYGHTIDIYGDCGDMKCPRYKKTYCDQKLERDYYFYLAFENSIAEDYVTEKVLTALQHNLVPVVYGGADYSRFLPPGSYLDATKMNVSTLAFTMDRIIRSPKLYQEFFRWKKLYRYSDPGMIENVCSVCEALNDEKRFKTVSTHPHFRKWWFPDYLKRCPRTFISDLLYL